MLKLTATWPAVRGRQQMMLHLDIEVDDLDPAGHPFCLYVTS